MHLYISMYCICIHYIHPFLLLFLLTTPSHNTAHNCVRIKWRWNGVQHSCQYLERHVDKCTVNRLQTLTGMICLLKDDQTTGISDRNVLNTWRYTRFKTLHGRWLWRTQACGMWRHAVWWNVVVSGEDNILFLYPESGGSVIVGDSREFLPSSMAWYHRGWKASYTL